MQLIHFKLIYLLLRSFACGKGFLDIVVFLFESGANIETENKYGATCLNTGTFTFNITSAYIFELALKLFYY